MADNNPWATAETASTQPSASAPSTAWDNAATTASDTSGSSLSSAGQTQVAEFSLADPFAQEIIPLKDWVDQGIGWMVTQFRPLFTAIKAPIDWILTAVESGLSSISPLVLIAVLALIAWQVAGKKLAFGTVIGLVFLGLIGVWDESVTTLSLDRKSVV